MLIIEEGVSYLVIDVIHIVLEEGKIRLITCWTEHWKKVIASYNEGCVNIIVAGVASCNRCGEECRRSSVLNRHQYVGILLAYSAYRKSYLLGILKQCVICCEWVNIVYVLWVILNTALSVVEIYERAWTIRNHQITFLICSCRTEISQKSYSVKTSSSVLLYHGSRNADLNTVIGKPVLKCYCKW